MDAESHRASISAYYGKKLQSGNDLRTSACCPVTSVPAHHRDLLQKLHPEVTTRFYGCGSPIPNSLTGATVLDLGCGTGRDAFLASALVGTSGRVIGIDMTDEQLAVARKYEQYHANTFFGEGAQPNTDFRKGFIEDLRAAGVDDGSVDVVISNCVCNLSSNKQAVFSEIARVLKQGGELYFSDVYADRRLSQEARAHPVLVAECLGGALYLEDFRRMLTSVGLADFRVVASGPIEVHDAELRKLVAEVQFYSVTVRAFKIDDLEDRREDYGQSAVYNACCGNEFRLDVDFLFVKNVPVPVDANTAAILQQSRFANNFAVTERGHHRGLFSPEVGRGAVAAIVNGTKPDSTSCCP